ncbi:sigma-70 family RNA polymerase sigma factor [Sporosalibacterium faouarense]|uniref:sigma-70 family RNA polymerase sigma factor n=1 Tax=Sporosalibacterium faouarense TaxID=516123 RepID=UPI00192A8C00|nr:sigma-70 family RNA polymerase sigma factor [Sporosalibacterium faouarense]
MPWKKNSQYLKLVDYIKNNQNMFYRLAYSYTKNEQEALDVVQEAIYKALTSVDKLKKPEFMKTWMYRIIVNTAISHIRENKKSITTNKIPDICLEDSNSLDISLDLYDAIDQLDEKQKTVILLKYFEDMKFKDIAIITESNINTVKTRLYSAISKLKKIIEGGAYNGKEV